MKDLELSLKRLLVPVDSQIKYLSINDIKIEPSVWLRSGEYFLIDEKSDLVSWNNCYYVTEKEIFDMKFKEKFKKVFE